MAPTLTKLAATRIKQGRRQLGLTQQGLADRLAAVGEPLSRGTLAKVEAGVRDLTLEELAAVAIALNVPPTWLVLPQPDDGNVRIAGMDFEVGQVLLWLLGDGQLEQSPYSRPILNEAQLSFRLYRDYYDGQRRLAESISEVEQMRDVESRHGSDAVSIDARNAARASLQSAANDLGSNASMLRLAGLPVPPMDATHRATLDRLGIEATWSERTFAGRPVRTTVRVWDADLEARYDPEQWTAGNSDRRDDR